MQGSRRKPLFTADNMRHLHEVVVNDVREVIGREFVGRLVEHLVIENRRVYRYFAADNVVHNDFFARFYLETYHILVAACYKGFDLFGRHCQRVAHGQACRCIVLEVFDLSALALKFLRCIECDICLAAVEKNLNILLVYVATLRLPVRALVASETYAFVELDSQPAERFKDILLGTRHKTVRIGIFYTEDKVTAMLLGKKIII